MLLDTDKQKFVDDIAKYVQKYAGSYGISVHSPIIAQAILESGWGKSRLAADYHNYFGMKCGTKWTGPSVNMTTQEEYTAGTLTTIKDNFRVYDNMENGVKGYFEFIQLSRYENLKGITSPQKYIETIKNDGYATSSTYVDSLMQIIKLYNLTAYDNAENAGNGGNEMGSRKAMIAKMQSWIGKNEADGSFREIIDIYNSHTPRARGYRLQYSDEWCAGTVSAAAIATGNTDAVPLEVSCHYMIEGAKAKGIWVENDAYVPQGGDIILYDWQDSGVGDNTGNPDHVGVVEYTSGGIIHVIEGNNGEKVARRELSVNGRYIRGFIVPKYSNNTASGGSSTPTVSGTIDELARRVIAGEFGSGDARKNALGDKYTAVQERVNEILNGTASTPSKSVSEVAKEVLAGSWGNGSDRKAKLEAAGYNYDEVQNAVNALCNKPTLKSVSEIAKEVLAGKWGNGADRKNKLTAAGYNYNEVQAAVNSLNKKSVTTIAKEVIAGKWGNGSDRKKKLESAGYNYNEVQKEVNRLL